jgi:hypothetical protein
MHTVPFWLTCLERIMSWWISTVPTWMQPAWFWKGYYLLLDRFG